MTFKRWLALWLAVCLLAVCTACGVGDASAPSPAGEGSVRVSQPASTTAVSALPGPSAADPSTVEPSFDPPALDEDGVYDSRDEVALYLTLYGRLPGNYITKKEARKLGWNGGGLEPYAPGKCIGGDTFGNYEGQLPDKAGRRWTECDIDTLGAKSRGAKRLVFSNDGLIYYTGDHYEHFERLYGEETP